MYRPRFWGAATILRFPGGVNRSSASRVPPRSLATAGPTSYAESHSFEKCMATRRASVPATEKAKRGPGNPGLASSQWGPRSARRGRSPRWNTEKSGDQARRGAALICTAPSPRRTIKVRRAAARRGSSRDRWVSTSHADVVSSASTIRRRVTRSRSASRSCSVAIRRRVSATSTRSEHRRNRR